MENPDTTYDADDFTATFGGGVATVLAIGVAAVTLGVGLWTLLFGVGFGKKAVKKAAS